MQLNSSTAVGSVGVSVITPVSGGKLVHQDFKYNQPKFLPQHQKHMQKGQNSRPREDGHNKVIQPGSSDMSQSSGKVAIRSSNTFISNSYQMNPLVMPPTQGMKSPSSKHLSNKHFERGEMPDFIDRRIQYCNYLPADYQHVLQDHSYSQLPESPPFSSAVTSPVRQKTAINGAKGTSNFNFSSKVNNKISSSGSSGRINNQNVGSLNYSAVNNHSSISPLTNNVYGNAHVNVNITSANSKKNSSYAPGSVPNNVPRGLLKTCVITEKPEESDLSEDDRILDPHGEETETAPEAEGEEESVTRCICDFQHDDGYMISCDKCLAWQHVVCMGIDWHEIPDEYQCEKCQPRYIDKKKAVEIQKRKLAEKLCVGANDGSDSSDTTTNCSRNNRNQTKRKYKAKRMTANKKKNAKDSKENKPKRNAGNVKKRLLNDSVLSTSPQSLSPNSNSCLTAEKKKQLLLERKQMLLQKKQITKKRTMRKQTQNSRRLADRAKMDNEHELRLNSLLTRDDEKEHSIQQVRDWVDRYEEAVTNHYSQELRARLSAAQINGASSDLKFSASLRSVEKCRTSLLSTGEKIVLATCNLSANQPIIELRGKYMYTGADSFKQNRISQFTPYVFYYKLALTKQDIEICVDCRSYGNFARFIRRSCKPNAELRHCIRKTSLHLYIIATQPLKKNSEILIGHYSPETANSCVCGLSGDCTAADTPYPSIFSNKTNDRLKDSSASHLPSSTNDSSSKNNRKHTVNADKTKKKTTKDNGKKKLIKEKPRGRRKSPGSESNSDRECSSRDQSPCAPSKLTVSLWGKPTIMVTSNDNGTSKPPSSEDENKCDVTMDNENNVPKDDISSSHANPSCSSPVNSLDSDVTTAVVKTEELPSEHNNNDNDNNNSSIVNNLSDADSTSCADDTNCSTKSTNRTTRQSDYAKKEKQQLDMPLFFQTPNNHKMTREEKKIQAIMKVFEAMEKSEAKKQENQRNRRESTSESEIQNKKCTPSKKNCRNRRNTDESKEGDKHDGILSSDDKEYQKENSLKIGRSLVKSESRGDLENDLREKYEHFKYLKLESRNDSEDAEDDEGDEDGHEEEDDDEDDDDNNNGNNGNNGYRSDNSGRGGNGDKRENSFDEDDSSTSKKYSSKTNDGGSTRRSRTIDDSGGVRKNEFGKYEKRTPTKKCRTSKPVAKTKSAPSKVTRGGKKRKSDTDTEPSPDQRDRVTRSALQRQKKITPNLGDDLDSDVKIGSARSPTKSRRMDEMLMSPYSTPPKCRDRLDSSSSSGGTPPTPVSDTCLLVASAIGHLTDFKFPNTKKELMNAWFKEERKPTIEEDGASKLPNQEANNEYAKKRWLRQAISEEGDNSSPRPDDPISPNAEYGGPLKKRRFARESVSEQLDGLSPNSGFIKNRDDLKIEEPSILFKSNTTEMMKQLREEQASLDDDIAKVASESVADTIASILAPVNAQMASPPRPPSVPPPRTPSPPPEEPPLHASEPPVQPVNKKKLSLTEYRQRKGVGLVNSHCSKKQDEQNANECASINSVAELLETEKVKPAARPSSRASLTSSSGSDNEDDDDASQSASAQVIARSLLIESRQFSYGPQASALYNSIRSGATSGFFNATNKNPNATAPVRENLAERLKREFNVNLTEDENEKKKFPIALSPIKMHPQLSSDASLSQKDVQLRLKKSHAHVPPPPVPSIPPVMLPPLPEAPHLFGPSFYPYPVPRVTQFFANPPPPPPPPPPSSSLSSQSPSTLPSMSIPTMVPPPPPTTK